MAEVTMRIKYQEMISEQKLNKEGELTALTNISWGDPVTVDMIPADFIKMMQEDAPVLRILSSDVVDRDYDSWLAEVNSILDSRSSLTLDELPDVETLEDFTDGVTPERFAQGVIDGFAEEAGEWADEEEATRNMLEGL